MDKIEKIRQEIERRIEFSKMLADAAADKNLRNTMEANDLVARQYSSLLSFLDTLSEEPDKDLEEAANKHIHMVADAAGHPGWDWTTQDIADAFIAGAKWQEEQLMKDAVEAMVTTNLANRPIIYLDKLEGLKYGDKVKVIVLKED